MFLLFLCLFSDGRKMAKLAERYNIIQIHTKFISGLGWQVFLNAFFAAFNDCAKISLCFNLNNLTQSIVNLDSMIKVLFLCSLVIVNIVNNTSWFLYPCRYSTCLMWLFQVWEKAGEQGLLGVNTPAEHGGIGGDALLTAITWEEQFSDIKLLVFHFPIHIILSNIKKNLSLVLSLVLYKHE